MPDAPNLQNVFLNHLLNHKMPITVFLVNGVKLQGVVTWYNATSLLLRRDDHVQLVYKHAISTIMPNAAVHLSEEVPLGDGPEELT